MMNGIGHGFEITQRLRPNDNCLIGSMNNKSISIDAGSESLSTIVYETD